MYNQPLVVRAFFNSLAEVQNAQDQLDGIGVWNDWVSSIKTDPHPFKLIFVDTSANLAKTSIRRINAKPALVQIFDPHDSAVEGWPEFKAVSI